MTNEEISRLAHLKTSTDDKTGMEYVDMYISLMSTHKSTLIRIEQITNHDEEADYEELEQEQKQAQELYNDYTKLLKQTMKSKKPVLLKEYLSLLKKETQEKFEANKSPMYVPQSERMEYSAKQIEDIIEKRDSYAKIRCIAVAQSVALNLGKNVGGEGK